MHEAYEWAQHWQAQYGFQDIAYSVGLGGMSVELTLTRAQIEMVNAKVNEKDAIIFRAEANVCMRGMATRAGLPQTRINGYSNILEISGSVYVIDLILLQLFAREVR